MLNVSRMILSFLDKRSRVQLCLLLLPMLATTILEMASIGMILPLLQIVLGGGESKYLEWLPKTFLEMDKNSLLILISAIFAAVFIGKNLAFMAMVYVINLFTQRKLAQLRQRMFDFYLRQPYSFHLRRNSAVILRDLQQSTGLAFLALQMAMNMALELLLTISVFALLLIVEPTVTAVISVTMIGGGLLFYRFFTPMFQRWGEQVHKTEARFIQSINQGFGAIKDIKVLNCYSYMNRVYADHTNRIALFQSRNMTSQNLPRAFVESLLVVLLLGLTLVLIGRHNSVDEVVSILGLFGLAALRLMPSMNRILGNASEMKRITAPIKSIHDDLQDNLGDMGDGMDEKVSRNLSFDRSIRMEGISYTYPSEIPGKPALRGVNLTVAKGESIGIVGPSGGGKTTLVDILMGLLPPGEGKLLVDGVDVSANLRSWQLHLGYVPQQIYLLDDTLRRNIAFGVEDGDISDDRVMKVISMAHLENVLSDLPDGLDTMLGERGARLSGGQRQRIGIARALYRDPEVLVFDEATSSLDGETEREISQAVEELAGDKTLIIIAHRLSTVRKCDRLVFMKDGQIVDTGSFDDLVARNREFAHMVEIGNVTASGQIL